METKVPGGLIIINTERTEVICALSGILLILLFGSLSVAGDKILSSIESENGPGIYFPETRSAIELEVNETINAAENDIAHLCAIPETEGNETNTLLELDNILTRADQHLQKYPVLAGLYPDPDLQDAAANAAERRSTFIQNISSRDDLYHCIQNVTPESPYGKWLKEQEITFFTFGGAGILPGEKEELNTRLIELDTLQNQYLKNIREEQPLSANLQIFERTVIIRDEIASIYGFQTWTDYQAKKEGWIMNGEDISTFLKTISPQVKEMVRPVMEDLLTKKRIHDPNATEIFDYEIDTLMNSEMGSETRDLQQSELVPRNHFISRSLIILSCLMGLKTEYIPDAQVYAPGVQLYQVTDQDSQITLGWFFLDLQNRPNKSEEWFTAIFGSTQEKGTFNESGNIIPVFLLSGTFDENTHERQHKNEDITQFYHELGHLYTRILTSSSDSSLAPQPFPVELTEASSKLFEYLVWTPEFTTLLSISKGNLSMPFEEIENRSLSGSQYPYSSKHRWDLALHTIISLLDNQLSQSSGVISFGEWYSEFYSDITGARVTDQGGYLLRHPHLSSQMAGMYWIYPIGDLYATTLFSKFQTSGVLNKTVWSEFIETILIPEKNGEKSDTRVRAFLGVEKEIIPGNLYSGRPEESGYSWTYIPRCIAMNIP